MSIIHLQLLFLAVFGLTFLIKESSLLSSVRAWLIGRRFVGPFFYGLFECYFCTGTHSAIAIYVLDKWCGNMGQMAIFVLAGATMTLVISGALNWMRSAHN